MSSWSLALNGAQLVAESSGAVLWRERGWLIVADLHLEKGSAFAARGVPLPPYDTAATLGALERLVARERPARVLCLGDSFHDRGALARMGGDELRRLSALCSGVPWLWITGNHDPVPPELGGAAAGEIAEGPLQFRHEARPGPAAGELSGHFHPKAAVRTRLRRVTGRCFASDGRRLILPAFGAYAGGLNVLDPAVAGLLAPGFQIGLVRGEAVYRFPAAQLLPEPLAPQHALPPDRRRAAGRA
jgi:DNA ligase-associated metallophosphoesterase